MLAISANNSQHAEKVCGGRTEPKNELGSFEIIKAVGFGASRERNERTSVENAIRWGAGGGNGCGEKVGCMTPKKVKFGIQPIAIESVDFDL